MLGNALLLEQLCPHILREAEVRGVIAVQVADLASLNFEGELASSTQARLHAGPGGDFRGDLLARCLRLAHSRLLEIALGPEVPFTVLSLAAYCGWLGVRRSVSGDFQFASDVESGAFLDHERCHRLAPFRFDLGKPIAFARLGRVPDRDPDDLISVGGVTLVGAEHPFRELRRPPRATEFVARARAQSASGDPDVGLVELHDRASLCEPARRSARYRSRGESSCRGVGKTTAAAAVSGLLAEHTIRHARQ